MNSINSILKDKSLWLVTTLIITLYLIVPFTIFKYSYILAVIIGLIVMYCIYNNKKGVTFIIFTFGLMLPYGDPKVVLGASKYITYLCVFLCIVVIGIQGKRQKYSYNINWLKKILFPIILLGIFYTVLNESGWEEGLLFLFYILSTIGFFYICFYDTISLSQVYSVLDIIFLLTFFYTIQDSVFHDSPYQFIYNNFPLDFQIRAKGLMGHPLLLSSFLSFYNVALLTRVIIFKKWSIVNFILLYLLVILSASKTVLVLVVVSWVFYVVFLNVYRRSYFYYISILLIAIGLQIFPVIENFISVPMERIMNSNASHRIGAYSIAEQVFSNNIFGIGFSKDALKREISGATYRMNADYDVDFLVFDNAYLTALASCGIFSILLFVVYFYPVYYAFKSKNGKDYNYAMLLTGLVFFLQNFSFDSIFYFPVNSFYFILIANLIKECLTRPYKYSR